MALFAPELANALDLSACANHAEQCSAQEDLLSVLSANDGAIRAGDWIHCGSSPLTLSDSILPEIPFRTKSIVGGVIQSVPLVEALVEAYRNLVPWDAPLPGRPGYLRSLVFKRQIRH